MRRVRPATQPAGRADGKPLPREARDGEGQAAMTSTTAEKTLVPVVRGQGSSVTSVDIEHRYGDFLALDKVSLDIRPGEFLTLLGSSGSGKSTLLRIIAGLTRPTGGRVHLDGRDVTDLPPQRRQMGFVFQSYALFPHLTVAENVAFPLQARRVKAASVREQVREALAFIGLESMASRYPGQLSGGQQQRVALARAIVFKPSVLLLDEPLGALDRRLRQQLGRDLRRIQRETGLTTVYVTHDQEEAFTMSDRIAVIDKGKIRHLGTPAEVYHSPKDVFVAHFLGDVNLLPGVVSKLTETGTQVRISEATVTAAGPREFPVGDPVVCAVRPEAVTVGGGGHGATLAGARVEAVFFQGSRQQLVLHTSIGIILAEQDTSRGAAAEGDTVTIGWAAEAVRILAPADAEGSLHHVS
jgi:ABC-type Fe3+/spermidine/putrescine transport system ATPase subunit